MQLKGASIRGLAVAGGMLLGVSCGAGSESGVPSDGLAAHYPLDGDATELVGAAHGIVTNATPTSDRHGNDDGALHFDGTSAYARIAHDDGLDISKDFAIAAWISREPADPSVFQPIFEKSDPERDGHSRYGLWLQGGLLWACFEAADHSRQPCAQSSVEVPVDGWHHVAAVRDERRLRLYLDGVEVADEFVGLYPVSQTDFDAFMGTDAYEPSAAFLHATLDDVLLFDRALTADEVAALAEVS